MKKEIDNKITATSNFNKDIINIVRLMKNEKEKLENDLKKHQKMD